MEKKRSGRPRTPRQIRQIEQSEDISRSTILRIIDEKNINTFKRTKTMAMNDGARQRRVERTGGLGYNFATRGSLIRNILIFLI